MFNFECVVYALIILYSIIYQVYVIVLYNKNKKIAIKDGSGLYAAKDILNKHGLGTLYVTKINGKYNDYYDIGRNVIHLSEDVYVQENLSSIITGLYLSVKAISIDKNKRKQKKTEAFVLDWLNKIAFVLFIIGASTSAIDMMTLAILILISVLIFKYYKMTQLNESIAESIKYITKSYKLKSDVVKELEKNINVLLYNELSLHIFNNRY